MGFSLAAPGIRTATDIITQILGGLFLISETSPGFGQPLGPVVAGSAEMLYFAGS